MASYLPTPKSKRPKPAKAPEPAEPVAAAPEVSAEQPALPQKPVRRKSRLPDWAKGALTTLALALLAFSGIFSFLSVENFFASGMVDINIFNPSGGESTPLPLGVTPTVEIPAYNYKPWNEVDRVTILALGLDARDWGPEANSAAARSDTMLVLSMDPIAKTAAMLSIPRDLYVDIPGYGFDKINKAYFLAEKDRLPIGGPGLAIQTVENLLGLPIDYYAVVDFNSFTTFVDTIGGIDVYVPFDNMVIDPIGDEDVKELFFGWNHLSGSEALAFARSRSTEGGDFDRGSRTMQVILAIRDKILTLDMVPKLILEAGNLYEQLAGGIKTNLTLEQIVQLALVAKDVPRQKIPYAVIDESCLLAVETFGEEDVLIPNLEKVRELRNTLFSSGGVLGYASPPADLASLALKENAKIEIVNGSGTDGLAGATRDWLVRHGFSEANITATTATAEQMNYYPFYTLITDYSGRPYTVRLLYELMGLSATNLKTDIRFDNPVDVQIFLRYDWTIPD
ncbi:MAG: LCP family protein [Anaerolineales bacterium]|nr:LCP family protein [Anaerolineales bacterium]